MDDKNNIALHNIGRIMAYSKIRSASALSKKIGIPNTTWHSYIRNPASNSTAKKAFCDYFGLTVTQLEEKALSEEFIIKICDKVEKKEKMISNSEMPLAFLSDLELLNIIKPSSQDVEENEMDEELKFLKHKVIDLKSLKFKSYIENARALSSDEPSSAVESFNLAFLSMQYGEEELLTQKDLQLYVDLSVKVDSITELYNTVEILSQKEGFNYKVLSVFAVILEKAKFIDLAKKCLNAVISNTDK